LNIPAESRDSVIGNDMIKRINDSEEWLSDEKTTTEINWYKLDPDKPDMVLNVILKFLC
jgi:hypothetical protein